MGADLDLIRATCEGSSEKNGRNLLAALAPDARRTEAEGFPYARTYIGPSAITQPLARHSGAAWADERLEPLSHAYLAMLSQAAIWFPATDPPDKDASALEAHARLLVQMGRAGMQAVKNTNAH